MGAVSSPSRLVQGHKLPTLLYGTAWKEDDTERCVSEALRAGFRGVDTANQRKHYFEEGVGRALKRALADGSVHREDLFIQTKFTYARGQDHRLPYDPRSPFTEQVKRSFESSLLHLGVSALDALVLHGPWDGDDLAAADHEVWRALESIRARGGTKLLGVSNVSASQVRDLVAMAVVPPAFVQNRCYARHGWDADVRRVCGEHGIVYQGFSLLTANRQVVSHPTLAAIARRHRATPEQVVFAFALDAGMLPLTGTTNPAHMSLDLAAAEITLDPEEVTAVTRLGAG